MTWLYLPSTCCPSAPASEASNSDCSLPTIIGDRLSEACATWRGKQQQSQAWSRRWKQGGFIRRLSGLTLEPSTAQLGVDAWISSLREIRAKAIPWPESGSDNSTIDGCSTAQSRYSMKAGLQPSGARTCRGTRTDSSPLPFQHWSDWAAALRSEYSARPKPEIRCGGNDCSSWPSARTSDTNGAGEHGDGGMDFRTAASNWEAPSVAVTEGSRKTRGGSRSDELLLTGQAEAVSNWHAPRCNDAEKRGQIAPDPRNGLAGQGENLAAPAARDHKGSSEGSMFRQDGKSRADLLDCQAEQFFHPPLSPDQPTIAGGSMSSTDIQNTNQPSVKRKLNPIFVEALMRWPTGLSGFERQEMVLIRWQQLMPSYLLMLLSSVEQAPDQAEMFC